MTADAARLAQIRDRSQHLAEVPLDTRPGDNCIVTDLIASADDVRWLLKQLHEQWGIQSDTGMALKADDRASAERKAARYSRLRLPGGEAGQNFHVVHRLATDWQHVDVEQQPEDGDRD